MKKGRERELAQKVGCRVRCAAARIIGEVWGRDIFVLGAAFAQSVQRGGLHHDKLICQVRRLLTRMAFHGGVRRAKIDMRVEGASTMTAVNFRTLCLAGV